MSAPASAPLPLSGRIQLPKQVTASVAVALLVAVLIGAILRKTVPAYGGARSWADFGKYSAPDGIANWISPALVLVASAQLQDGVFPILRGVSFQTWCIVSVVAGLVSTLTAGPVLRTARDLVLSLCAGLLAVVMVWEYVTASQASPLPATAMISIFALMFLVGVVLNILRTFNIPRLGLAALGAVEILLFLIYPFNIEVLLEAPIELNLLLLVVAGLLGAAAAAAPSFLIPLAGIAIFASEIGVNVYLWISAQGRPSDVDWTGATVIIGTQVGAALGLLVRGLGRSRL